MFDTSFFSVIFFTTISSFGWYYMYLKLRRIFITEPEFTARIVAALHAVVVVIFAYISLQLGPNPLYDPGEPNTVTQNVTMLISIGYFIYDFFWCVRYQPEPKIMLIHHLASIVAILFILLDGKSGAEAIGGLGSLELTNPLLQARWFLRTFNKKNTPLYNFVEYLFLTLFLVVRLGYGSFLLYSVTMSKKTNLVVKLSTVLLYLISLAFIYSIGRFVVKKFTRPARITEDSEEDEDDGGDVKLS
ncbi:TLC domain-containing protein 5-like [Rhodnius prolixus]|uniref:TLC domain-containing protein n=1 Tax=Rhodnius prolixus TaxID=13249 RepID=T1I360_RHOPR